MSCVTAHYDHIGVKAQGEGDTIFNGANDNASGISALIEIARAIARSPKRPLRSIAFIAFFGEERGLVGSRYYARNPVFPIDKTYAQINLEQLGRTDDSEGRAGQGGHSNRMGPLRCRPYSGSRCGAVWNSHLQASEV